MIRPKFYEWLSWPDIRKDVPHEVLGLPEGTGHAFLDVLLMVKRKFESGEYQREFPGIKPKKNRRVAIIFHGKDSVDPTLIKLAIGNAYIGAASLEESESPDDRQGLEAITVYDRDPVLFMKQRIPKSGVNYFAAKVEELRICPL